MVAKVPAPLRVIGRSVVDWWDGWLDMVLTIIVWFFAQLTIVLGPPATFGLYYVVHQMINGEAMGVRGLISGGRKYFGKAWLWGIINILVAATLYVNVYFYSNLKTGWAPIVLVVIIMLGYLWYCTQFYVIPFFLEQEVKSLYIAMKNGFLTTLAAPFFTFIIMFFALIVMGLSIVFIIPIFLGLPALIPFLGFRSVINRLEAFGLREREKTPREIEMEESEKANAPGSGRFTRDHSVVSEIADGEGDIEKGE
ncbi:MAG: hypothetical protein IH586_01730 [Anaerolineaceae bacterium]|nr:hypothetical protein [Anaerolineaceae bacterium]